MLKLSTMPDKTNGGYVRVNDAFFELYTKDAPLDETACFFLKKYDGIQVNPGTIPVAVKTKFSGDREVEYSTCVSTGVKTLLNLWYISQYKTDYHTVNVTECGPDALVDAFELATKNDITLVLQHSSLPDFIGIPILVDGCVKVDNGDDLY